MGGRGGVPPYYATRTANLPLYLRLLLLSLCYNIPMTPRPLTPKQERFATLVASGLSQSDAYRQAYDVSPDTLPQTVWVNASQLAANTSVALRTQELRQAAKDATVADIALSKRDWLTRVLADWDGARQDHRWASANGAAELYGRAVGYLADQSQGPQAPARVTIVFSGITPGITDGITDTWEIAPVQAGAQDVLALEPGNKG